MEGVGEGEDEIPRVLGRDIVTSSILALPQHDDMLSCMGTP